ncbi:MAG: Hpt domain-containing protein [Leptolyngbya sp. UWPOB_LEPTO1]|uniref:Hpt domain-containing protein n=1 Tax=Leptolyngbya sp. UWPOB_LEPTO1 TaxID=2815653 RepID=UPI001ACFB8DB|nr:Hpt domain-containing protein [Leptolyngbya sp. UWPOB_LEPTO1]MBN8561238.1 Hpt domain-containing protein [Leptolyngbya sp. UWPOB_LEPTO1]
MQSVKQQQILGYFIEEAKEHLDTIEQGLVDLAATMADSERVNELFRAAHSVKGGAAMLGFDSIQRTAHHFEDCFKILKEHPVKIDQRLEDLFFKGFDTLKELIEALQSPFGLREEDAQQAVAASEPTFRELQAYLEALKTGKASPSKGNLLPQNAATQITTILKGMLQLFKQGDSQKGRQQLVALCNRLIQVSSTTKPWVTLLQTAQRAIANPKNTYASLAPIVIKDLKQASDLLLLGQAEQISITANLQKLLNPASAQPASAKAAPSPAVKQQVTIPLEPRAAARTLLDVFNKSELIEIAEFLMKAIQ